MWNMNFLKLFRKRAYTNHPFPNFHSSVGFFRWFFSRYQNKILKPNSWLPIPMNLPYIGYCIMFNFQYWLGLEKFDEVKYEFSFAGNVLFLNGIFLNDFFFIETDIRIIVCACHHQQRKCLFKCNIYINTSVKILK
jgi:hypothetical protein